MRFSFHQLFFCLLLFWFNNSLAGNNAVYEQRKESYIDSTLSRQQGNKIVFQAFRNLPLDTNDLNYYLSIIPTKSTSDFDIIVLVRLLFLTNGEYDAKILPVLNSLPFWINYGDTLRGYWSENHMIMWMSSDWLLYEKYNNPIDTSLYKRLKHYLELKNKFGYYEFNSSTYAPYTLCGLLNLADFAQDTLIKNQAARAAQKLLSNMLLFTNNLGVYYPVAGRNYPGKYFNPYDQNHSNLIYLLTGFNPGVPSASISGAFLATSTLEVDSVIYSWQPNIYTSYYNGHTLDTGFVLNSAQSKVDKVVFQWSSGAYFHPSVVTETVQLLIDSNLWEHVDFDLLKPLKPVITPQGAPFLAESLSMISKSTVISGAQITLFKNGGITLSSIIDFWKGKVGFQQYSCVANVGTTAVYTATGEVKANWNDRNPNNQNTHLPYVNQKQNVALLMYRPEETPPVLGNNFSFKEVALHWRDADFDETVEDSLWLLGRQAERYVAVRRHCIGQINGVRACPTNGGQTWVIVVGDSSMYGNFSSFRQVIHDAEFQESWHYDSTAAQSIYFASVTVDTIQLEYAWGIDSVTTSVTNLNDHELNFGLYPNPAQNEVVIQLPDNKTSYEINLYDLNGNLISATTTVAHHTNISIKNFTNGLLIVECKNQHYSKRRLLSVQH